MNATVISKLYTAAQIDEKITELTTAYMSAAENKEYALDTTQSRQRVENQDLDKISDQLECWLKAKLIKSGEDSATIYAGKFSR